ncbi:hypothetical protein AB0L34_25715 [Micromonospora sp. NPDC052213]|uniref:hypothetical protein n=1 Tax=Micromonospora sp. NPDC052213 TaxID=3155812 RepID=UPI00341BBB23
MNGWEIILGIVFGLLVNEVTDISPWLARKLTRWSAYRWTTDPDTAAGYAEEWAAVIDDRPGKLLKLLTALRFTIGAASRAAPRAGVRVTNLTYLFLKALLARPKARESLIAAIRADDLYPSAAERLGQQAGLRVKKDVAWVDQRIEISVKETRPVRRRRR